MSEGNIWNDPYQPQDHSDTSEGVPKYQHYNFGQEESSYHVVPERSYREIPRRDAGSRNRRKEKNGFGKKAAVTVALAVIFGLVAGIVFQGVNLVGTKLLGTAEETVSVGTTELLENAYASSSEANESSFSAGSVSGVAQAAMPSVVAITSVSIQEIPSLFGFGVSEYPSTGSGSGIIVGENDEELLIATNNHVVEGAKTLNVCFIGSDVVSAEEEVQNYIRSDGEVDLENAVSAKIKGTDEDNDLAVVAVQKSDISKETMSQIKIAQLGNSDALVVGEQVVAIGNALGYGQSVTSGWVSALDRPVTLESGSTAELIQTDAAINPGNSGGALLNMRGELIGINSAKYADSSVEGMGYAIPISKAEPILMNLMNRKTRDKVDEENAAYLGIQPADVPAEAMQMYNMPAGVFVMEAAQDSAAMRAGIQKGDIIVELDGQKVSGMSDLTEKLQYYEAGETIDIVIARADSGEYVEQTLRVELGSRP